ncbi:MAG: TonB-dependent receptor [Haliscomenobacter sp.]|nr:TonB-dependent receptor [Haliscomenobacter sp.]
MRIFLYAILALVCPLWVIAQDGSISGTINDEKTGEPLIGASVFIEGAASGSSTDFDGKYQFKLPVGTYTIIISYTGYSEKQFTDVVVKANETTYLDAALNEEGIQLDAVVVTAKATERSENAILLLQRRSDKIQDGISSQEMSRFAVSDVAAAMKKVTGATVSGDKYIYIRGLGDRYSLSQLNGLIIPSTDPYRNSAQLDLIPTNLLDNIITSKTFTPDLPGTFTGGNVDIRTKSFPEEFSLSFTVSGEYNTQSNLVDNFLTHEGGPGDYWGFVGEDRKLPAILADPAIRNQLSGDIPITARLGNASQAAKRKEIAELSDLTSKILNRQFSPTEKSTPLGHSFGLTFGNQFSLFNKPLGVIFSASFKQSFEHLDRFQKANWILFDVSDNLLLNQGDFEDTRSTENPTLNGLFGLAYKFSPRHTISFNALYNHNTEKQSRYVFGSRPDNIVYPEQLQARGLSFTERELTSYQLGGEHSFEKLHDALIEWKVSLTNSSMDDPYTRFFENQWDVANDVYDIPLSNVQQPFYFFRELTDEQIAGKLDLTLPFSKTKGNKVKFGTMLTQKDREFTEYRFNIATSSVAEAYTVSGNPEVFTRDANMGIIGTDNVNGGRYFIGNYLIDATVPDNNYTGYDDVLAFYGMLTLQLNEKLKFVGGARYEKTDLFAESAAASKPDSARIGQINDSDLLPSLNLIYNLKENMNLRASFSQTLARPNMRELAPFAAYDAPTKEFYLGNPKLDKTNISNFDLRWEYFMNPGELLAISGYYKSFNNPIVQQYRRSASPEIEFTNVDKGFLYGIELEFRKDLEDWIGFMRNFKLNTNFSFIDSKLDVVDFTGVEPDNRPFEGQAPFIVNAGLNYVNKEAGLDAILALNIVGDRMTVIGREGTPDIYDRSRTQLDFNIIKELGKLQARFSAKNLLNAPYVLSSEYKGQDFVYSKFQRGVTFGLGISYTIR